MIKRILVGVCQSPSQFAIAPIVIDIASRNQAVVTGMALLDTDRLVPPRSPTTGVFPSRLKAQADTLTKAYEDVGAPLRNLRESAVAADAVFQEERVESGIDRAIGNAWQFQDLLVISNRPWFAGEKSPRDVTAVLHFLVEGIRPILAVSPYAQSQRKKAMVALSGSLESAKAMKHFVRLGLWPEISVHLVTSGAPKSDKGPEHLLSAAADYATAHGLEATTSVLEDGKDRTSVLVREAEKVGADTLVLGSSYRRFLNMERFGNHAQELLRRFEGVVFLSH